MDLCYRQLCRLTCCILSKSSMNGTDFENGHFGFSLLICTVLFCIGRYYLFDFRVRLNDCDIRKWYVAFKVVVGVGGVCTCVHTSLQEGRGDSLPEALKSTHVHLTEQTCAVFFGLGLIQSSKQHPPLYTVIFSNRKCSNFSKQLTEPCDKTDRSVTKHVTFSEEDCIVIIQ